MDANTLEAIKSVCGVVAFVVPFAIAIWVIPRI